MSLSLEKLKSVMLKKGMIPIKYFINNDKIVFIKIFIVSNCNIFMLYIDSEFNFVINKNSFTSEENICSISKIDIANFMKKKYGKDIREIYSDISLSSKINLDDRDIEKKIDKEYNQTITLEDIKKDEESLYIETYKQIDRIKNSFSKINYRFCICADKYIFYLIKDTIKCFCIDNDNDEDKPDYKVSYFIISGVENFFEKIDNIEYEIHQVISKIEELWNYTQKRQYERIMDLYSKKDNIVEDYKKVCVKKDELVSLRNNWEKTLEQTCVKEKQLEKEYNEHNIKSSKTNYKNEMNNISYKKKLEDDIRKILTIKKELTEKLSKINNKINDFDLTIDNIFYTNFIMMNNIRKNIKQLAELTK